MEKPIHSGPNKDKESDKTLSLADGAGNIKKVHSQNENSIIIFRSRRI